MPVDFPDIESVISRVCKPVDQIIRQMLSKFVDAKQLPDLFVAIKKMPRPMRVALAEGFEKLAAEANITLELYGRGKYFREPMVNEPDEHFRLAAADWMCNVIGDPVEANEIRTGRGWDKQSSMEMISGLPGGLEMLASLLDAMAADKRKQAVEDVE